MRSMELYFKASINTNYSPIIQVSDDNWLCNLDPSNFADFIHFDIYEFEESDDELYTDKKPIGFISGVFFDIDLAQESNIHIFDLFDSHNDEYEAVYEALIGKDGEFNDDMVGLSRNILYLDRLYISPEFRRKGIGYFVISNIEELIRYCYHFEYGCLIIKPYPLEMIEGELSPVKNEKLFNTLLKKLIKLYKQLGFKLAPDNKHMYINTDYIVHRKRLIKK